MMSAFFNLLRLATLLVNPDARKQAPTPAGPYTVPND